MIYLIALKTYRWTVFVVFFVALMYAGLQNTPNIYLPFKTEILTALGLLIAFNFGLAFWYGSEFYNLLFVLYFDNHYTIVLPNGLKRTVTASVFREIQHEYDGIEGVKIYYNNPEALPNAFKRIR